MRRLSIFVALFAALTVPGVHRSRGEDKSEPKALRPILSLDGETSKSTKSRYHRVESTEAWESLWAEHQTGMAKPKRSPREGPRVEVDFKRCMVIAVFDGEMAIANGGFLVESILERGDQFVFRVQGRYYQTGVGHPNTTAWAVFVLPRTSKVIVIEENVQRYQGKPPIWKQFAEMKPGDGSAPRRQ